VYSWQVSGVLKGVSKGVRRGDESSQSRNISLDGLFCNSDLSNAIVNINVNLSK
jgi:hypothetical protein